jgi:hypothetical protein
MPDTEKPKPDRTKPRGRTPASLIAAAKANGATEVVFNEDGGVVVKLADGSTVKAEDKEVQ